MPPKAAKPQAAADAAANATSNGPDETAVRQAAVVSSTFANVELQTTRRTLKEYVQLFDDAREENQRLNSELVERDKDSMRVVQFLRAELDGKIAEIASVQKQHKADLDKVRADFHSERKRLLAEINDRDEEISALQNKCSVVQGDLSALQTFASDRDRLYAEMHAFREHHQRECERYEAEISRLRFVSLEEKVRVKAEERIMTEKFEAEVNDRAMKLLDVKTRSIHNENFALLQDKVLLEQELDRLVSDNKSMKSLTSTQKREVELAKVADDEYAKRGARQSREIKDLRNQCKLMEQNIAKLIDEYEHKLDVQSSNSQTAIDALKEERDLAIRNAELRHKELVKMRQLTKSFVSQRSELEIFFNEALEYVREQILIERNVIVQEKFRLQQPGLQQGKTNGRLLISDGGRSFPAAAGTSAGDFQHTRKPSTGSSGAAQIPKGQPPRGGSGAMMASEHPFFQGSKGFDSLYTGAHDDEPVSARVHSQPPSGGPRRISSGAAALPLIHSKPPSGGQPSSALVPSRHSTPAQLPPAPPVAGAAASIIGSSADISQLSWIDKERVLRILLAKINNAARYERKELPMNGDGLHVVAPVPAPKQLLEQKSDTFLTQM